MVQWGRCVPTSPFFRGISPEIDKMRVERESDVRMLTMKKMNLFYKQRSLFRTSCFFLYNQERGLTCDIHMAYCTVFYL